MREEERLPDGYIRPVCNDLPLTSPRDVAEWAWELAAQLETESEHLHQAIAAFGWRRYEGQEMLRFPGISRYGVVLTAPEDTVRWYRASWETSLSVQENRGCPGLYAHPNSVARGREAWELEPHLNKFLAAPARERKDWVATQRLNRTWALMHEALNSCLVGGSTELSAAQQFGNVICELDLPKEVLYRLRANGIHDGERENLVPFAVHPTWIKRVLANDRTVLLDFDADPVQQVSDEGLARHLT